jgi:Ca-activated chloride channel family protein
MKTYFKLRRRFCTAIWFCITMLTLVGLLVTVLEAQAEGPVTVQVVQVDKARFPEVDVYVSVTDANGQPVKNLMPEDFSLEEGSQPVSLTHVSRAGEQGPVTAVLVIDKSGSMNHANKMEAAREAAIAFVQLMRPEDATGVIAFNTQVTTVQPLTDDKESLIEAIRGIEAVDDTAMYDALHSASAMLESVSGRKAIITVTDGMNTAGQRTREETLTLVGEQDISIYTIGLGDPSQGTETYAGIDEPTLKVIAEESGGIYTFAPNPEDLRSLYELLSLRIQNEYKLTYRSPNRLRDGTNRAVAVTVAAPSGPTEVAAAYNPGGVIPEVAPRSTWRLFGLIFAVLAFLLVLPGIIGKVGVLISDRGPVPGRILRRSSGQAKASGKGKPRLGTSKAKSAKGRIRLTGEPRPPGKRSR